MKSQMNNNLNNKTGEPHIQFNVSWTEPTEEELLMEAVEFEDEQFQKQFKQQFKKLNTKKNNKVIDKYHLLEEAYLLCKEAS